MKVKIDEEACIGCDLCSQTVPDVFEMSDEVAVVIQDPVSAENEDEVKDAAESCPTDAIAVIE